MSTNISRRAFLKGAAGVVAAGAMVSLTGCSGNKETPKEETSGSSELNSTSSSVDWLGSAPTITDADCKETLETEVLVVGAGCSGLFAACAAAEEGAKTMLIEKFGAGVSVRCSAIGGVNSKIQQANGAAIDKTEFINDYCHYALNMNKMSLVKLWADNSGETLDWYSDFLAKTGKCEIALEYNMPSNTRYKAWPIGHGTKAINMPADADPLSYPETVVYEDIIAHLTSFEGCEYYPKTPMQCLIKEDNKVVGIYAKNSEDNYIRINASKGVIIATGGYASNETMYTALQPETKKSIATMLAFPGATGDGIKAAMWAGAKMDEHHSTMIFDRCALSKDVNPGSPYGAPFTYFHLGTQPFLKVNEEGNRICNESSPYDFVVHGASKSSNHAWYQIFDSNWKEDVTRFHTVGCSTMIDWEGGNHQAEGLDAVEGSFSQFIDGGLLIKADTIEELAEGLGINTENFVSTVDRYNELYNQGEDTDFGKEYFRMSSLTKAPYYGVKLGGINLCTLDGIYINTKCQALDANDQPIEGLYMIGNDSGNFYLYTYPNLGAGTNAGRCATFGRLTGKYVASL